MNNIVISASTECQCSKKTVFRVKVFGYRGIVAWKTYFEKFDGNFQWGTQAWWEYLKTIMQKKLPLENSFHEKLFWRTLLSVGVQKPGDRKEKLVLGPFPAQNRFKNEKLFLNRLVLKINVVLRKKKSN